MKSWKPVLRWQLAASDKIALRHCCNQTSQWRLKPAALMWLKTHLNLINARFAWCWGIEKKKQKPWCHFCYALYSVARGIYYITSQTIFSFNKYILLLLVFASPVIVSPPTTQHFESVFPIQVSSSTPKIIYFPRLLVTVHYTYPCWLNKHTVTVLCMFFNPQRRVMAKLNTLNEWMNLRDIIYTRIKKTVSTLQAHVQSTSLLAQNPIDAQYYPLVARLNDLLTRRMFDDRVHLPKMGSYRIYIKVPRTWCNQTGNKT